MSKIESINENNVNLEEPKLTPQREVATRQTQLSRRENRMNAAERGAPILVSEQQFVTVREEHLASLDLLNSSGQTLLKALDRMIPHDESVRGFGEYTAKGMRQLSKSLCDIVITKNAVVRQMYTIARDEI